MQATNTKPRNAPKTTVKGAQAKAATIVATPTPNVAPVAVQAAPAPVIVATPSKAPLFTLNPAAALLAAQGAAARLTLQSPTKGLGQQWRAPNYQAPNLRAIALANISALGATFTELQAQGALKGTALGSGTPRSFVVAFIKNGYLMPVVAAPVAEAEAEVITAPVVGAE